MDQHIKIQCPRHHKRQCEVFTSQTSSPYCLLCIECFQEEAILPLSLISIEDILNEKKDFILKNWPPLGKKTQEIFQNLMEIKTSLDSQGLVSEIYNFFERAERSLVEAIRNKQKEVIQEVALMPQNSKQFIKEYQQIAKIELLKNTLTSSSDPKVIEQNLRSIIQNQTNNMRINSEKLENLINLNQFPASISLNEPLHTLNQLIQRISLIELLPPNKIPKQTLIGGSLINFQLEIEQKSQKNASLTSSKSKDCQLEMKTFKQSGMKSINAFCEMIDTIQSDKKYILKLQFINNQQCYSSVNFIPLNSNFSSEDHQIQFSNYGDSSFSRVIKGKDMWCKQYYRSKGQEKQKKVGTVELRICIQDKYILVIDRPSYQNAMQLSSYSPDKFISDSDYKMLLYIYSRNDSITIEEMREVDCFPEIQESKQKNIES